MVANVNTKHSGTQDLYRRLSNMATHALTILNTTNIQYYRWKTRPENRKKNKEARVGNV